MPYSHRLSSNLLYFNTSFDKIKALLSAFALSSFISNAII